MDKSTRNAIERATQQARKLLDDDFSSQLEGTFDVLRSGVIAPSGGVHLSSRQQFQRGKIVAAIDHKRAAGMTALEAVADYVRDAAFTTLNRFIALKMLEARELVQECITKGEQSSGYREFCGMAPGLALIPDAAGYRLYVESLFDEFSTEIKVLFDRRDAASVLWPKRQSFEALLTILNAPDLFGVWGEDETIGWVYQFFNSGEERKKMRDKSQAPRNGRELAVRNQFFTPRYVVQFLVDNTLGRLWLEMHGEQTSLTGHCEYLVRSTNDPVQARLRKDPRDLRILDPACGSGHFLLYSFDLLLTIYEEAWSADGVGPISEATECSLRNDYPELADLRRAVPRLIVEHNLHGVDIDPRCAQIAALALWLRAQRAWKDLEVASTDRPRIQRTHIVVAEPMPGEAVLVDEFATRLDPPLLRDLFKKMVGESRLSGELGTLLRVEDGIAAELHRAREQFVKQRQTTGFLPGMEPAVQQDTLDLSGIDDDHFFHEAENRIIEALRVFAETATGDASVRRRLFAGDAAQGIAFIDILRTRFDVVLMNPPFGDASKSTERILSSAYPAWNCNLLCAFVARAGELMESQGLIGSVVDRTIVNKSTYEEFRRAHLLENPVLLLAADLGWEVLDANVEVAALVLGAADESSQTASFFDVREVGLDRPDTLKSAVNSGLNSRSWKHKRKLFSGFPSHALVYDLPDSLLETFANTPSLASRGLRGYTGHQLQSSRHFFLSWELPAEKPTEPLGPQENFCRLYNGGEFSRFLLPHCEIARFGFYGSLRPEDVTDYTFVLRNKPEHFKPGVAFGVRGEYLDAHLLASDFLFTVEGQAIPIEDEDLRYFVLGYLNSSVASRLLNCFCGQHKYSGYVNQLPCPDPELGGAKKIALIAREACEIKARWFSANETCDWFQHPNLLKKNVSSFGEFVAAIRNAADNDSSRLREIVEEIDSLVLELLDATDDRAINDISEYRKRIPAETVGPKRGPGEDLPSRLARDIISFALGCCFGRWKRSAVFTTTAWDDAAAVESGGVPICARSLAGGELGNRFLVDDPGASTDLVAELDEVLSALAGKSPEAFRSELLSALGFADLREYLRASRGLFDDHLKRYTDGRRTAPIYWQIGTPSGRYSVWFYAHGLTRDSLFRLQNDVVTPKLAHEERQLTSLIQQASGSPSAKDRKEIASQEAFVEELRALLSDVKCIAPLWDPTLDDGLSLTMAPLWRLVSQHKPWQKELKRKWDELATGKYDWAHIAMHLWPQRVVPKCATDRSLAISHGLKDVFWVDEDAGKWKPRQIPARQLDELVQERTTIAIRAALEELVETSAPNGSSAGTRRSSS